MKYFVKTPWWLKKIYPFYTWSVPTKEKILYLTFDDGPHPEATPFVLTEAQKNLSLLHLERPNKRKNFVSHF